MSDLISSYALAQEQQRLTHPHTHVHAQLGRLPHGAGSLGRRRTSTSSSHSHTTTVASVSAASSASSASSVSPASSNPSLSLPPERSPSPMAVTSSTMPKLFKVEIAHNGECKSSNPIFYPSDLIHGMVHLHLDKPMALPALKVVFRGESNYPSSKQQDHLDHNMRRLFSVAMTLWGSRDPLPEDQWGQLPAGNHVFPFTIQLPDKNLPASFDHPWLKNQYTLTAYYRRPNGLSKWQSKAKPINFMPLSTPGFEHGPIQETCPKMGTALLLSHPDLTPGGRVIVKMTAAAAIDRCHFSLSRHIRARINETIYKEDEVICHYERKSIPKGEINLVLPIPKITPPTTESLSALKITYSVQVSIWNERFFFKTESHNFDFPIVIRTLPSCDNQACEGLDWCEPSVDRPMFLTEELIQPLPLYNSDRSPPTYTQDLPSYDQCVNGVCAALETISVQGQGQVQAQEHEEHEHNHEHDPTPRVEDQDQEDERASISSDVGGHGRGMSGHSRPHHPSCVYYVAPDSDRTSSALSLSSDTVINDISSGSNNINNINMDGNSQISPAPASSPSNDQSTTEDAHSVDESFSSPAHGRVVEYLKVHTTIESV